jgi:hypothetical protein
VTSGWSPVFGYGGSVCLCVCVCVYAIISEPYTLLGAPQVPLFI